MITAQDLKGALAIMPTPAKEGADRLDATNTVDLDETARLAESLVRDGATGIMALGTMGECATTSQADYEAYVDCLLKTVRGRIPTFVGTTALSGHDIARRIKFVKGLGATGTLLGIPMWQPATLDMAVKFYADVAQTFPDFPIMVYANPRAFRFAFDADFWGPVVDKAPTVMSAKFSSKAILKKVVERHQRKSKLRAARRSCLRVCANLARVPDNLLDPRGRPSSWLGAHESTGCTRRAASQSHRRRHRLGQRAASCDDRLARCFCLLQHSDGKNSDGGFRLLQDRPDSSTV